MPQPPIIYIIIPNIFRIVGVTKYEVTEQFVGIGISKSLKRAGGFRKGIFPWLKDVQEEDNALKTIENH